MRVELYNNEELLYASRKRHKTITQYEPYRVIGDLHSVRLGDGANTSIKIDILELDEPKTISYVTINGTRWFVTDYIYLNSKQVQLNLQRDVVGEYGVDSFFGQIERGYTTNFLKNRKELSLNQILKERKNLIPSKNVYGNYSVSTHEKEMWGILYFVKKTQGSEGRVRVDIPAFQPETVSLKPLSSPYKTLVSRTSNARLSFVVRVKDYAGGLSTTCLTTIDFTQKQSVSGGWEARVSSQKTDLTPLLTFNSSSLLEAGGYPGAYENQRIYNATKIGQLVADAIIGNAYSAFILPSVIAYNESVDGDYQNAVIKETVTEEGEDVPAFFQYSVSETYENASGTVGTYQELGDMIMSVVSGVSGIHNVTRNSSNISSAYSYASNLIKVYTKRRLTEYDMSTMYVDTEQHYVDEPFCILVCPLYDTTITRTTNNKEKYTINRTYAFNVFNTVIETLSGTPSYLIDAQIYPYAPEILEAQSVVNGMPFFSISGTTYTRDCPIDLFPNLDVKKEYIEREYSIVSPDKSGKFSFNFYDYTNVIEDLAGRNSHQLTVKVKTSLKPYGIITCAVVVPDEDSLIGIYYDSDMRGCLPSANGFQCTISSDAFEAYKRSNSNYQEIFALQQDEMKINHQTERVNERVQGIMNTISATAFGAIAGAQVGGAFGKVGAGIGAGVGGTAAAATVGAANIIQYQANERLRNYEEYLLGQRFDLEIGTIKNLPNSISRISTFNEIIMNDFWYVIEIYECSAEEKIIVDNFISNYSYGIGVFDYFTNYIESGWFVRGTLTKSNLPTTLHDIAAKDVMGGIYYYEQE